MTRKFFLVGSKFFSVLIIASLIFLGLTRSQSVSDRFALLNYTPSPEIEALATESGMSTTGKNLFYINDPKLNEKSDFRSNCPIKESTIVLGCYTGNGIYVLRVVDDRLEGIEQVTSAHEMLHAAYDRLSGSEKDSIDKELVKQYEALNDERLKKTIDSYKSQDPSVVPNELHSILGTEYRNIGSLLENHYKKYFDSRDKVVSLAETYQSVFISYEKIVEDYDRQLSTMSTEVSRLKSDLENLYNQINSQKQSMETLLVSGDISGYNSKVSSYNNLVQSYNSLASEYQLLIDNYNGIVAKRNDSVLAQRDLVDNISTTHKPITE